MRILDKAVYVGPSLYAHFPVIRLDVDLGALEDWPSGKLGPAFTDAPARRAARAPRARLLLRQARRLRPPADRGRGHLDGPRPGARRHRAAERRRRAGHLRQDPLARRRRATTTSSTSTSRRTSGSRPAGSALTLLHSLLPPRAPARGRGAPRTSTSPPSGTSSSASPSAARSAPAPCRWCARPRSGESRGSGSTSTA